MHEIQKQVENYFGIKSKDFDKISNFFDKKAFSKDEYLLKQNQYQTKLGFIITGYIRIYNIQPTTGKEITQWISTPGTFVADASSLFFDAPARFNIQTLTDCELFYISQENFKKLNKHVPNWSELEKLFMAKCFSTLEDRVYSHLSMTSEERYKFFFEFNSELFNQVPLQYISSMLGMTPETFSRIRKKLSS